jgi:exfoliative toxin A/B
MPVPMCGLALGLASLDLFFSDTYEFYTYGVCALLSLFLMVLFTLRIFADPRGIMKDLENPAVFGVLPTYTMTLMILSTYAKDVIGDAAAVIWAGAVAASFVFIFFFVKRFFLGFDIKKVFPGWMVIFIGYVVASVTSPAFGMQDAGQVLFWCGFAGCMTILPLAAYRTLKVKKIPESLMPQIVIFAAPANLCMTGCIASYGMDHAPELAVAILAGMGVVIFLAVAAYLPFLLRDTKFYPSYAAYTFPLVISAISFYRLIEFYGIRDGSILVMFQEIVMIIAVLIIAYVFIRYMIFFYQTAKNIKAE